MIRTADLKEPKKPSRDLRSDEELAASLGIVLTEENCPRCGGRLFVKRAPCFLAKYGFRRAVKCLRCAFQEGRDKRK